MSQWVQSSYCGNGAACVQVGFQKSSYSVTDCIEVGTCLCHGVSVRDSKDPDGPILLFGGEGWEAFIQGAKAGEFDLPT